MRILKTEMKILINLEMKEYNETNEDLENEMKILMENLEIK